MTPCLITFQRLFEDPGGSEPPVGLLLDKLGEVGILDIVGDVGWDSDFGGSIEFDLR